MKDIVIAGIAGSGKGTQARALRNALGGKVQYFEPGSVYRALASNNNILGNYTKTFTSIGELVPDGFTKSLIGLVFSTLEKDSLLLVDGFPRMYSQKHMFDEAMQKAGREFIVFLLDISEEEAIKRLHARLICPTCGTTYSQILEPTRTTCAHDDTELIERGDDRSDQAIQERFENYYKETLPGLREYEQNGILIRIDGTQSIENITQEILTHIDN